jgi:hypothetical protein
MIDYNFHRHQPFYKRGEEAGIFMLDRIVSKKPFFFFQYRIDQHIFYTYMIQKQFFKDLFFTKDLLVNSNRYLSKDAL